MITIERLSFQYAGATTPALQDVNLTIAAGEFVGLVGAAGAGKTTLLRCINGLIPHFYTGTLTGRVYLAGVAVDTEPVAKLARLVGTVLEDAENQLICAEVEEEVAFALENLQLDPALIRVRVNWALEMVGAAHLRRRPTASLSGGEKQRVAIATVLALQPRVLVLDEPTSELDPLGTEDVFAVLGRLHRELGITVVVAEQKTRPLAQYAGRIVVLDRGRIVMDGPPRAVFARGEELAAYGVRLPQVAALAAVLGGAGKATPLTPAEGRAWLEHLLRSESSVRAAGG